MQVIKLNIKRKKPKILVIGDLIVDQYFHGEAHRIAQEAPTPIVRIENVEKRLGGAANVIHNLKNLGSRVMACGIIGDDENGKFIKNELRKKGINVVGIISDKSRITTVKNRVLVGHHHMIRFDEETEKLVRKSITNKLIKFLSNNLGKIDAIIVSDYDKGVITEPLVSFLKDHSLKKNKLFIVDPKKRNHNLRYGKNSIIKTNIINSSFAVSQLGKHIKNKKEIMKFLCKVNDTSRIILTMGKEGMFCYDNGTFYDIRNTAKNVFDVTGAGDVVLAVFAYCFLSGNNFEKSCRIANSAASINVAQIGTYAITSKELNSLK